ncbi:MFS transporter [Bacillus cereus]|nr:MFS transporter [Bacillus cereus]
MNNKLTHSFALFALISGFFMAILDSNIVNIVLPEMTISFNTSVEHISWVINSYNLAFAVCLLPMAKLADRFGRKKFYVIGLFVFTISSLLCGLSISLETIVLFRVIQGISAAIIVPVAMPLGLELVPKEKQGIIGGIMGAFGGLAAAIGPALGGILSDQLSWKWIFFINIPIGLIACVLVLILFKESYDELSEKKIDWLGVLLSSLFLFTLVLALLKVNDDSWNKEYIILLFVISIISFISFINIEKKSKYPILPLWLFNNRQFSVGNLLLFIVGMGMMNIIFLLSFFLTQVQGISELKAGLIISVLAIFSMIVTTIMTPIATKKGSRWIGMAGMLLLAVTTYSFTTMSTDFTSLDYIWRVAVGGVGTGCTLAPISTTAILSVPVNKSGMASSITNISRTIGSILGVAVLVALLNNQLESQLNLVKKEMVNKVEHTNMPKEIKEKLIINVQQIDRKHMKDTSSKDSLEKFIYQIEERKKVAIHNTPEELAEKVNQDFELQEKTISDIYQDAKKQYKKAITNSFNNTYRYSCIILILGIIFSVFNTAKRQKSVYYLKS